MPPVVEITRERRVQALAELYTRDFYSWALQQADALRRRDYAAADWENVIEEIEDVGRSERRTWTSHCAVLVEHMLKLEHWKSEDYEGGKSWFVSIRNARRGMLSVLEDNLGLKPVRDEVVRRAWKTGRSAAGDALADYESGEADDGAAWQKSRRRWLAALPTECPYTLKQIEDPDWFPRSVEHKQEREWSRESDWPAR